MKKCLEIFVAGILCFFAATAHAQVVSFSLPLSQSENLIYASEVNGVVNDFTFSGQWWTYSDLPFMQDHAAAHSISYNPGSFTFAAMSLNGWPGDDNPGNRYSGNGLLSFQFRDVSGQVIQQGSMTLGQDNTWHTYQPAAPIAGVHEIYFLATGTEARDSGFFPRLASITIATPVPEPETGLLFLAGLGLLGAVARRRKSA